MLTKMPKVGEVIIADKKSLDLGGMTVGKEYVIKHVDSSGHASFTDDDGSTDYVFDYRFDYFTLKSEAETQTDESIGNIVIDDINTVEVRASSIRDKQYIMTVATDIHGYHTIMQLAEQSQKQRRRTDIQAQIDALQAELNAL